MNDARIRPATSRDLPAAVMTLLKASFLVIDVRDVLVGAIAAEFQGFDALLRART